MNNNLECNSFNISCNPASPWYQNNKGFLLNDDLHNVQQTHVSTTEKKIALAVILIIIALGLIVAMLSGVKAGLSFSGNILFVIFWFICFPYVFLRNPCLFIKNKLRPKKPVQLELPL